MKVTVESAEFKPQACAGAPQSLVSNAAPCTHQKLVLKLAWTDIAPMLLDPGSPAAIPPRPPIFQVAVRAAHRRDSSMDAVDGVAPDEALSNVGIDWRLLHQGCERHVIITAWVPARSDEVDCIFRVRCARIGPLHTYRSEFVDARVRIPVPQQGPEHARQCKCLCANTPRLRRLSWHNIVPDSAVAAFVETFDTDGALRGPTAGKKSQSQSRDSRLVRCPTPIAPTKGEMQSGPALSIRARDNVGDVALFGVPEGDEATPPVPSAPTSPRPRRHKLSLRPGAKLKCHKPPANVAAFLRAQFGPTGSATAAAARTQKEATQDALLLRPRRRFSNITMTTNGGHRPSFDKVSQVRPRANRVVAASFGGDQELASYLWAQHG